MVINLEKRNIRHSWSRITLATVLLLSALSFIPLTVSADSVTWRGEYYNNKDISGSPALIRDDSSISFNWGTSAPATGVSADGFSVRWTAFPYMAAGDYTFSLILDDGGRLYVDDALVIDQWKDQSQTTYTATRYLSAGYHSFRVEYYENTGNAVCQLTWSSASNITEWRGEYYNNTWLGGDAALVRNDSSVSFNWGTGSPASGINSDNFSARWTRTVNFSTSGTYTFSGTTDDGLRVYVDGTLIIDKWYPQSASHTATKYIAAGNHDIKIEYYELTGTAKCQVSWSLGQSTATTIVVDEKDANFTWGGSSSSFYNRYLGYNDHLYWTWNSKTTLYNWAKWYPYVSVAGDWEVFVYVPSRYFGTTNATYSIYHNGTKDVRSINQSLYYDQWVSLGTYTFSGGSGEYVYLGDNTGETYATRFVGFDAVKFVYGGTSSSTPTGCSITPVLGFGRIYNGYSSVSAKLGCATQTEYNVWAGEESFQNGTMIWLSDSDNIYVLNNNGTWAVYSDTWQDGDTEWDTSITAPSGYYQPKRGFGKLWRDTDTVRSGLGWATTEERGFEGSIQQFSNGLMFWSNVKGIYVLYSDNTWQNYQ